MVHLEKYTHLVGLIVPVQQLLVVRFFETREKIHLSHKITSKPNKCITWKGTIDLFNKKIYSTFSLSNVWTLLNVVHASKLTWSTTKKVFFPRTECSCWMPLQNEMFLRGLSSLSFVLPGKKTVTIYQALPYICCQVICYIFCFCYLLLFLPFDTTIV